MKVKKYEKKCIFYHKRTGCDFMSGCKNTKKEHKSCDYFDSGIMSLTNEEIDQIVEIIRENG
ncbi:MAG: hypothetical protein WC479_09745 [Candidatus Izemoplasmatales bacterium]